VVSAYYPVLSERCGCAVGHKECLWDFCGKLLVTRALRRLSRELKDDIMTLAKGIGC
jgi:hypothetical protein